MQEKSRIIMKWKLFPKEFLVGYEDGLFTQLQARVDDGEITIQREANELIEPKKEQLQNQDKIINFLTSVSLTHRHISFSLIPTDLEIVSEGARYLDAEAGIYTLSGMEVDFILKKNEGQLVVDSKKERMSKQQELFELISDYGTDPIASKILGSYRNAIDHDEKVLIYIYEIRDSLKKFFGNGLNAIKKLSLDKDLWNCFGDIANDSSIKQGRHYSEVSENSRDITDEERRFALSFGQRMIENYLQYVQQHRGK